MWVHLSINHTLHHSQVLQIIMRLEQRITREELDKYTSDTPDITRIRPAQPQDNLRGTVMPRGDDRGVVLVLESSGPEVDESDFGV